MDRLPCKDHGKAKLKHGYGRITRYGKQYLHHRVAWAEANGVDVRSLSEDQHIMHKCDNPCCIEPTHLELGTHIDNMRDMRNKGRSARGERNGHAVLTWEQVRVIRAAYIPYHKFHGGAALARLYNVDQSVVSDIVNNRIWKEH